MRQGVSKRLAALWKKFRALSRKEGIGATSGFLVRPDGIGRMEIISVEPGFDLHLRNVEALIVTRNNVSGRFRFKVDTADRETIEREKGNNSA